jgi:tyrosine-protein phosphatase SIW14
MKAMHVSRQIPVLVLAFTSASAFAGQINVPGVPNFHQVNDHIYRGGQPNDEGWKSLAKLGIKTVIDLRRDSEDNEHWIEKERKAVEAAGMRFVSVPMQGIVAPTDEAVAKVLGEMTGDAPVFVHCKKGKDRTGTVVACYRIAHDRWDRQKAFVEAKSLGFHWYEVGMRGYILGGFQAPEQTAAAAAGAQ